MANKKRTSFSIFFWLGLILLAGVLYLAFTVDFRTLLARSGVGEAIKKSFGGDYRTDPEIKAPVPEPEKEPSRNPAAPIQPVPKREPETKTTPEKIVAVPPPAKQETETAVPRPKPAPAEKPKLPPKPPAKPASAPQEEIPKPKEIRLYFVRLGENGGIHMVPAARMLPSAETPLADLLGELLAGPSPDEKKRGLLSLIPQGTKILSVSIKDETAFVNLNDAFRFNSYGVEGFTGQLRQFIFTLTELAGIKKVQLLIEGKVVDYLSPEGIFIGRPLGREAF